MINNLNLKIYQFFIFNLLILRNKYYEIPINLRFTQGNDYIKKNIKYLTRNNELRSKNKT